MSVNFKTEKVNSSKIIKDVSSLVKYTGDSNEKVALFLKKQEIENNKEFLRLKGDCSISESINKIVDGSAYTSHALPFVLYNYAGLKQIENIFLKDDIKKATILELGCNNAYIPKMLQTNNFCFKEYWGLDFDFQFVLNSLNSFDYSKYNLFNINFISGDFNQPLNFKNNVFDFVYFQEAFDHCYDKSYYAVSLINELKRIIKPNKYLYITLVLENKNRDLYHWDHTYIWEKDEFETLIKQYFDIINIVPLLTFEKVVIEMSKTNKQIDNILHNWPIKFAKQICAPLVDEKNIAVAGYLCKNKKCVI